MANRSEPIVRYCARSRRDATWRWVTWPLVSQHSGQLVLAIQIHDQTREDKDIPARHGKSVQRVVQNHRSLEIKRLRRQGLDQSIKQILHILAYFRVFDDSQV